ncbi:Oidioi.mRNA.OKI2018_I69.PAR.g11986.t1.cds [Oikopleura dioica]|uniref:Oidioi.mRNA.OKI2018_I69.PAR.g11986.t1.cds n=1 Tax=Oikopleura dioica TaxID=34765 RepID=A0ABN7RYS9_OIKDI|nr:Oidioi.mRNA.OKI2018_I69.PAR.g11986.t1.cds [Oikopleura dioica]
MELSQELRELMSDHHRGTAENSYTYFLKRLEQITTSEEHAYLYHTMLRIMQNMMELEAYMLGRKLLIRLKSETFNGAAELQLGLTVDAKKHRTCNNKILAQPNQSVIFSFEETALVIQSFDEEKIHYNRFVIPAQNIEYYEFKRRILEIHKVEELIHALDKLASKKKDTPVLLQLSGEFDTELSFTVYGEDINYKLTLRATLKNVRWRMNMVERDEDCRVLVARKQLMLILDLARAGDVMKIEVRGPNDVHFFSKNKDKTIEITFPRKDGIRTENSRTITSFFNARVLREMTKEMDIIKFVSFRMREMNEVTIVNFMNEKFKLTTLMPSIVPPDGDIPFEEFYSKLRIYENDFDRKLADSFVASEEREQAALPETTKKEAVSSKKRKANCQQNEENSEKTTKAKHLRKQNSQRPASCRFGNLLMERVNKAKQAFYGGEIAKEEEKLSMTIERVKYQQRMQSMQVRNNGGLLYAYTASIDKQPKEVIELLAYDEGHPVHEIIVAWEKIKAMIEEVTAAIDALKKQGPNHSGEGKPKKSDSEHETIKKEPKTE